MDSHYGEGGTSTPRSGEPGRWCGLLGREVGFGGASSTARPWPATHSGANLISHFTARAGPGTMRRLSAGAIWYGAGEEEAAWSFTLIRLGRF